MSLDHSYCKRETSLTKFNTPKIEVTLHVIQNKVVSRMKRYPDVRVNLLSHLIGYDYRLENGDMYVSDLYEQFIRSTEV
jgi:NADH:ubiquinone oxidoreductase subunit C